jgi:hypothetical protein
MTSRYELTVDVARHLWSTRDAWPGAALLAALRFVLPDNGNVKSALDVWRTTRDQWYCLQSGLWIYGIFYAQKK